MHQSSMSKKGVYSGEGGVGGKDKSVDDKSSKDMGFSTWALRMEKVFRLTHGEDERGLQQQGETSEGEEEWNRLY